MRHTRKPDGQSRRRTTAGTDVEEAGGGRGGGVGPRDVAALSVRRGRRRQGGPRHADGAKGRLDTLDAVLEAYVERALSIDSIVAKGFDRETVERVARLVDLSEYKRKQAPVGLKVTSRAFGTGRRMPIAARYR